MEPNNFTDEIVLEFSRFSKDKQEQVRGLVEYASLMGLDGKDLISIGGKLERVAIKREIENNRNVVLTMGVRPINKDSNCRHRWAWKDDYGTLYHFRGGAGSWHQTQITNTKTNRVVNVTAYKYYKFGNFSVYQNRDTLPNVMLNIYYGLISLP